MSLITREQKYEKVLFLLGDGANGKSVVLYVLQELIGKANYSAIPLEKFSSHFYLANLFGKLANISIETNAKSSVYDSTFKAVSSGDAIEADPKFKKPFTFRPFCKLIFALNNLPRVDDKTSAFYRRLLILEFKKVFKDEEQNKNLKYELVAEEADGIFNWCLEGLKRLKERGHFEITKEMQNAIEEYRSENNSVLVFVDERCEVFTDRREVKDLLYQAFSEWCKANGNIPLTKVRFGKEIRKQYPSISEDRTAYGRFWVGIGLARPLKMTE